MKLIKVLFAAFVMVCGVSVFSYPSFASCMESDGNCTELANEIQSSQQRVLKNLVEKEEMPEFAEVGDYGVTSATFVYVPEGGTTEISRNDAGITTRTLEEEEIALILSNLRTSTERYALIEKALSVVGKIPYSQGQSTKIAACYGSREANAKADHPNYLDCSAFISWLTADICSFPSSYTTYGYEQCQRIDNPAELQPGDCLLLTIPEHRHIVMFVGWSENDRPVIVEENGTGNGALCASGGSFGNVIYREIPEDMADLYLSNMLRLFDE